MLNLLGQEMNIAALIFFWETHIILFGFKVSKQNSTLFACANFLKALLLYAIVSQTNG